MKNKSIFEKIFYPETVAIIGASERENYTDAILEQGPNFELFAVNPSRDEILGLKCYDSVLDIQEDIDYAIICVPAPIVPEVLEDCMEKGIEVAHIFSSGFSETGIEERIELEDEVKRIADGRIHLIGPNCMGVFSSKSGLTFVPTKAEYGPVSMVSQSGTFAVDLLRRGGERNIRLNKVVSYGNAIDLDCPDFLEYLADDPDTEIITLYIEGTNRGKQLLSALRKAAEKKPLLALKGGLTGEGSRAASSHTGSLAGSGRIWENIFEQTGVIQVESFNELKDTILGFLYSPLPRGKGISLVTTSGGFSVFLSDVASKEGLNVPEFQDRTKERLREIVPISGTSIRNPLDAHPAFRSGEIAEAIKIVGEDEGIHSVIIHFRDLSDFFERILKKSEDSFNKYINEIINACEYIKDKEKVTTMIALETLNPNEKYDKLSREKFQEKNLPVFRSTEKATKTISNMLKYKETHQKSD